MFFWGNQPFSFTKVMDFLGECMSIEERVA